MSLASAHEDGKVRVWDSSTGKERLRLPGPPSRGQGYGVCFARDGTILVTANHEGTIRFWDATTGKELRRTAEQPTHSAIAFSPDGKTLAVGEEKGILHLWDAVTGKELGKSQEPGRGISALAFAPDGKMLAVGSHDKKIHLLEASTGKELHTMTGHSEYIMALAYSPSGRLLASGSPDRTVRIWEVHSGLTSECHQFRGHDAWVTSVAFSPDGRRLVSGSKDSTALVWDVTGLAGRQTHAPRLSNGELAACWQSLLSVDTARAYQVMRTLAAADQAVSFLASQLQRKRIDAQQVARLLAELDSEDFQVRSRAVKELEKWEEAAEPALRQALKGNPSLELRRRIEQLLEELNRPLRRWQRVVEVLEWTDTPAARELLEKMAADAPWEAVGREAKATLKRLRARSETE